MNRAHNCQTILVAPFLVPIECVIEPPTAYEIMAAKAGISTSSGFKKPSKSNTIFDWLKFNPDSTINDAMAALSLTYPCTSTILNRLAEGSLVDKTPILNAPRYTPQFSFRVRVLQ